MYTKLDLDLNTMNIKNEGKDIKISYLSNLLAGFIDEKLMSMPWDSVGCILGKNVLKINHDTLVLGEIYMFLAKDNK